MEFYNIKNIGIIKNKYVQFDYLHINDSKGLTKIENNNNIQSNLLESSYSYINKYIFFYS